MRALISGQSGTAVVFREDQVYSIALDDPGRRVARKDWEILWLLAETNDLVQLDGGDDAEILGSLELAWEKDRALQLSLILIDSGEDQETHLAAAECLDELLGEPRVKEFIENRLYSAPIPIGGDLIGAIQQCITCGLTRVKDLFDALNDKQEEIEKRYAAWEALPIDLFGGFDEKRVFYSEAVRFGAFRMFATERGKKNWALIQLLAHPHFRGSAKARRIFQEWALPFKESATNPEFERKLEENDFAESEAEVRRFTRRIKGHDAFLQAEKQRDVIKALLTQGREDQALRFAEQLVANQRQTSDSEHIAKSLCDLAQFAKRLGSPELQLEFSKMAVSEAPSDGWSHATLGDAYRSLADFQSALSAFHEAGTFGNTAVALVGRAEVLKDLGQVNDALAIFDRCIHDFPADALPRNARAAALADFGRFDEALAAYNATLKDYPDERVPLHGRAQVLRNMGRLVEALKEFDRLIVLFPDDSFSQHARGETLRELGQLDDAVQLFSNLTITFPLAVGMLLSYGKVLRDVGKFDDALLQYRRATEKHPLSPFAYVGLADTYRKTRDLDRAVETYEMVMSKFPRVASARNGKAAILVSQGAYPEAHQLLPKELPAALSEWVAYHIRGMAYMREGRLGMAETIFERGLNRNPWASQRQYFQTALASLRIQQRRYQESIELVREVIHPAVEPIARILTMHALGELGQIGNVEQVYKTVRETSAPDVVRLRDVIAQRYLKGTRYERIKFGIFQEECDCLLLAA